MKEVLSKLHKACEEAGNVKKGERVRGMHFNPLLADDVKAVAMKAFLNNKLYPVCNYETHINDGFVMIICNLTIYDIENPNQFIEVKGSSGYGKLDKYGTGNGMTYSQKYAFLAALNLKTGIKDEDGYNNVEPLIVETSKPKRIETKNNESNSFGVGLVFCITEAPIPKSLKIFKNPVNTKIIAIKPKSSGVNNLANTEPISKVKKRCETLSIIDHDIPYIVLLFRLFI